MVLGVHPYLRLNGNGKEAVAFYQAVFDAELLGMQTYADLYKQLNAPVDEEKKDHVSHAQLKIGNTYLMLSDNFPDEPFAIGTQLNIAVLVSEVEKTQAVFTKLAAGGEVLMPLQETPFSPAYGQVKDQFGVTWQISTVQE